MRTIAIWVVAVHVILLMSPPLQLTDLFNYLGYARLGGVHHLNPYTHVIGVEFHDPVFRFTTWHHLRSPYGHLFTAITYPIAMLPIPVAYWVLKVLTVLLSLAFIWLVWKCATLLGRDPRFAVLFVAANPIYLIYAVGGFHNDFFMLVPLDRGDRAAALASRPLGRRGGDGRRVRQVHRGAAAAVPADRRAADAAAAARADGRRARGDPAGRAQLRAVRPDDPQPRRIRARC